VAAQETATKKEDENFQKQGRKQLRLTTYFFLTKFLTGTMAHTSEKNRLDSEIPMSHIQERSHF
jgi:hypothetical protein